MGTDGFRPSPDEPDGRSATTTAVGTVADETVGALTDSSGGTAATTLADIAPAADMDDTTASLAAAIEALRVTQTALLTELRAQGTIAT